MDSWSADRGVVRGATMTIPQAWELSQKWYGTRLEPDFRRPTADEARALFDSVGRKGSVWDL